MKRWSKRRIVVVAATSVFTVVGIGGLAAIVTLAETGHDDVISTLAILVGAILIACALLIAICFVEKFRELGVSLPGIFEARFRGRGEALRHSKHRHDASRAPKPIKASPVRSDVEAIEELEKFCEVLLEREADDPLVKPSYNDAESGLDEA